MCVRPAGVSAAEAQLANLAATFAGERRSVEWVLRQGDPATEIVAEADAWGADVIVMSTHGSTGIARALRGSVADAVVRTAPNPVLVINQRLTHEPQPRVPVQTLLTRPATIGGTSWC